MKPSVSELLAGGAMTLATGVVPLLEANPYGKGHATIVMMLALLAAQEVEKAADVLHTENARLRTLFSRAAQAPVAQELAVTLRAAGEAAAGASLRVSALQTENAALRALLIRLHAAVEENAEVWAAELDGEIWALLRDGARARLVELPPM
jgi:hypothetical protein